MTTRIVFFWNEFGKPKITSKDFFSIHYTQNYSTTNPGPKHSPQGVLLTPAFKYNKSSEPSQTAFPNLLQQAEGGAAVGCKHWRTHPGGGRRSRMGGCPDPVSRPTHPAHVEVYQDRHWRNTNMGKPDAYSFWNILLP